MTTSNPGSPNGRGDRSACLRGNASAWPAARSAPTASPSEARAKAGSADIVVTNHALLAINAVADSAVLPEHQLLVVDEAHELVDRVTTVATGELTATTLGIASRRIAQLVEPELMQRWERTSASFITVIQNSSAGRMDHLDDELATHLTALRDAATAARSTIDTYPPIPKPPPPAPKRSPASPKSPTPQRGSWRRSAGDGRPHRRGLARSRGQSRLNANRVAGHAAVGGRIATHPAVRRRDRGADLGDADRRRLVRRHGEAWGLADTRKPLGAGSMSVRRFEHAKSGILYVAAQLPPPGRDGTGAAKQLTEIAELITAAGGRTLGLFSSMRAARAAAEAMSERLSTPVLCQGDDNTNTLVERFAADPATSLFGTLSLWQGVDVPGPSLSLVIIDRIPFPRPDDPLLSARQRAVAAAGGNGFMAVAASHAALLLAQGAGRLLRGVDDRGWSRCWIRGWRPPATAATCGPRCRRSGRPPMRPRYARRWSGCARVSFTNPCVRMQRRRPITADLATIGHLHDCSILLAAARFTDRDDLLMTTPGQPGWYDHLDASL